MRQSARSPFVVKPLYLSLLAAGLVCAPAFAHQGAEGPGQSTPAASADDDAKTKDAKNLGAIRVIGERIEFSASALGSRSELDTPYSLRTIDREQLDERQVISVANAFFGDASVTPLINDDNIKWSSAGISVRGMRLSATNSYKMDGLPTEVSFGEWPLETVENVELLKGPTGFMYGFGAPGGIINYIGKRPTDERLLRATVGYRSSGIGTVHLDAGGRFGSNDTFGYRVNVAQDKGETYDGANLDRKVASVVLDARLSDSVTWDVSWVWQDRMLKDVQPFFDLSYGLVTKLPPPIDGGHDFGIDGPFMGIKTWSARSSVRWKISEDWNASLVAGRTDYVQDIAFPYAVLLNNAGDYRLMGWGYNMGNVAKSNVAQGIVEGSFETGPLKHQIVAGMYWMNKKVDVPLAGGAGCEQICYGNLYTKPDFIYTVAGSTGGDMTRYADTTDKAVFISDTVEFLPGWSALLGLRYNDYTDTGYNAWTDGSVGSVYNKTPTTPTIALLYKPREGMTLYTSYVESLEQGFTVGTGYLNAGEVLEAMISEQYEAGFKFAQGRWFTDAALFRIDRAATIDRITSAGRYLVQDGITRYQGVEWSMGFRPNAEWTLSGGVTALDATYKMLTPAAAANVGNRAVGASRLQSVFQLGYTPSALPDLSLHAGVRYYGANYVDAANTLKLPGYTLANAGFGYRMQVAEHAVTMRGQINNITGKSYWSSMGIGAPRTVSLNVTVDL